MKAYYEIGDKFYASDYGNDIFLKIQESLTRLCMKNNSFSIEEGRDKKGYYIILVENKLPEIEAKPLYSLQCDKKEELDFAFEVAINKPVAFEGNIYDCDNLSVLRMIMLLKAYESGLALPDYWIDSNNNVHSGDVKGLLGNILVEYYKRNALLDVKYNEILQEIYAAESKEQLSLVSFEKLEAA